jgi:hypothetical protein
LLLDGLHRDIVCIALAAAGRRFQVAFAGGGALQIYDVSARVTHDVDLFVRKARNVARAAEVIANALERAGYQVEVVNAERRELREFKVHPPMGGDPVQVQIAFFEFTGTVVMQDVGPVVTLDYLAARKAAATCERHQVRDYIDVASLVDAGYKIPQLLQMAFDTDSSLSSEDAGDAGVHLDRNIADERIARELPPGKTAEWVRAAFADWPREPVHDDDLVG